jgi:uncharacterized protein (UPF0248 family)
VGVLAAVAILTFVLLWWRKRSDAAVNRRQPKNRIPSDSLEVQTLLEPPTCPPLPVVPTQEALVPNLHEDCYPLQVEDGWESQLQEQHMSLHEGFPIHNGNQRASPSSIVRDSTAESPDVNHSTPYSPRRKHPLWFEGLRRASDRAVEQLHKERVVSLMDGGYIPPHRVEELLMKELTKRPRLKKTRAASKNRKMLKQRVSRIGCFQRDFLVGVVIPLSSRGRQDCDTPS